MSLGALRFQKLKPGLVTHCLFLLPEDPDVEISATLQHHVCPLATMFPTMMDRTSETVSQHQLNVFLYKSCDHGVSSVEP